jgi:hypothetical protein
LGQSRPENSPWPVWQKRLFTRLCGGKHADDACNWSRQSNVKRCAIFSVNGSAVAQRH